MGKSIRSKIKKRLRTAKRQRVDAMVLTPKLQEQHENLKRVIQGHGITLKKPKNAFKYPDSEAAAFPQHEIVKPIDYRAANLPMAQYAFRGNRRKYDGVQLEYMKSLAKMHPQMEVLAGGGAVMAKTGKKVSVKEAELIATRVLDPDAAAIAEAGPANAASAVAASVAEEDGAAASSSTGGQAAVAANGGDVDMEEASDNENERGEPAQEPTDTFDHTRPPIIKDTRRGKRARPRANAALKSKLPPAPRVEPGDAAPTTSAPQKVKTKKKNTSKPNAKV